MFGVKEMNWTFSWPQPLTRVEKTSGTRQCAGNDHKMFGNTADFRTAVDVCLANKGSIKSTCSTSGKARHFLALTMAFRRHMIMESGLYQARQGVAMCIEYQDSK